LINPAFDIDLNRSGNYKDNVNKLVMEEFHLHVQQMKVGETKYIVLPGPIKGNYIANSNKHFMPLTVQKTKNGCVIQHDRDNMPTWLEKYTKEHHFSLEQMTVDIGYTDGECLIQSCVTLAQLMKQSGINIPEKTNSIKDFASSVKAINIQNKAALSHSKIDLRR
jgi:hypothetical protein